MWVRRLVPRNNKTIESFNSRTRVGATASLLVRCRESGVSIHAPVWVRQLLILNFSRSPLFQFTHPCGCDARVNRRTSNGNGFQFTHPCGCDDSGACGEIGRPCFNSRTRVGATSGRSTWPPLKTFQFTHPCGCDEHNRKKGIKTMKFQFTHPCGCDFHPWMNPHIQPLFQFTHPCGCDRTRFPGREVCTCFNSRTRVGATGNGKQGKPTCQVSIHAPVWVRPFR